MQPARIEERAEGVVHRLVDSVMRRWPRPTPSRHLLENCRIISHRGEHDNRRCIENTLLAFDKAAAAGVWGLEMDIRWTRDLVPVVFHDADTGRLFQRRIRIADLPMDRIRQQFPQIPTLAEVIARYGGRRHLMLEVKSEVYPQPAVQSRRLRRMLKHLAPGRDFHVIGLQPEMFAHFDFLPASTFIAIARLRVDRFSRMTAARAWGGIAGHYLLATDSLIGRHHRLGQAVGTGFADSPRCLYREVARGVDWIFSNRAARMQAICNGDDGGRKSEIGLRSSDFRLLKQGGLGLPLLLIHKMQQNGPGGK
jgi:glycerophosphoryl diester phosphodiesterase